MAPRSLIAPMRSKFPEEMARIGSLLLEYGDLEIGLMNCVQVVRRDLDGVIKAMYRTRGEEARIKIADALGRTAYSELGLSADFDEMILAIDHCRKIRNQYAHAIWAPHDKPGIADLEKLARDNAKIADLVNVRFRYVDLPTIEAQQHYFAYTDDLTSFLNFEGQFKAGRLRENAFPRPATLQKPAQYAA